MKAMIFAAGLGTRLRPLTDNMPKALVPICGKPLLAWQLEKLEQAGFTEVVVNVHHFADQVTGFLSAYNKKSRLSIHISDERDLLLDTGGALKKVRSFFQTSDSPFLVHNVDILSSADLRGFYERYSDCDAALLVSERPTTRYLLFDADACLAGWTNVRTGEVRSPFAGFDPSRCKYYAFSGIQMISPRVLRLMDSWPDRFSVIDFYLHVCGQIKIRAALIDDLRLLDVGKRETLAVADSFLSDLCDGLK